MFPNIDIFFSLVVQDIKRLQVQIFQKQNITGRERKAIDLKNNPLFLIKEANKGGNIVLWPIELYMEEAHKQLNNRWFYSPMPSDPTDVFKMKFNRLLNSARTRGIISKKEHDYLRVEKPVTATFYLLPKVHKDAEKKIRMTYSGWNG